MIRRIQLPSSASPFACGCFVTTFALCSTLVFSTGLQAQDTPAAEESASELLYGVLDAGVRQFRFAISFNENKDGVMEAKLLSIDEGGRRFKLDNLLKTAEIFEFEITTSAAKYSGDFDATKHAYIGKWKQSTADLALEFRIVKSIPKEQTKAVWAGQINALLQKIDVRFRELESGEIFFDSVTQKAGGFVAKKSVKDQEITFDVQGIPGGAKFVGTLNEDESKLTGQWRQGLIPLNLTLDKQTAPLEETESKTREPDRPQTPQPPFPYTATDVTFENDNAGISLAGTLTVPEGKGPFPAVVLISGSGPQDRDESIMGHKPFWVIADHFARDGIAVLRYDDRGVGRSLGQFANATSHDFAADASAAVKFLRTQAGIDPKKIGLCGHSEGGIIAPIVASLDTDIAFIILLAGPGVNGEKILASQSKLLLEASGMAADAVDRQSQMQAVFLHLATQTPQLSAKEFIEQATQELKPLLAGTELEGEDAVRTLASAAAAQLGNPWFRYFMTFEPANALEKVRCPVLALIGEKDLQVGPKLNIPALEQALSKAPADDVTITELPGLNHLFQHCNTGLVSEYAEIEETISPDVLQRMAKWIQERMN